MINLKKNLILIISLGLLLWGINFLLPQKISNGQPALLVEMENNENVTAEIEPLPELEARSVCVFDLLKNTYLLEQNSSNQLPLASLTKLMTALIAEEYFPQTTIVKITKEAVSQDGDNNLRLGETWKLKDLIDVMLITSSNDAAFAVADSLPDFLELMNKKARQLNLTQTYFLNSSGLDNIESKTAGGYSSCKNLTELIKYIFEYHPNLLEATTKEAIYFDNREFKNTNKILRELPSFVAGKTGWDELAGGNLIVVVDKGLNHPIVLTVLGSSIDGRFNDMMKLYDHFVTH